MNSNLELSLWNVQHKRLEMLLQTLVDHPEFREALAREIIASLEYFLASFGDRIEGIGIRAQNSLGNILQAILDKIQELNPIPACTSYCARAQEELSNYLQRIGLLAA